VPDTDSTRKKWCPACDYVTSGQTDFLAHASGVHPELAVFACPHCEYFTVQSRLHLKAHLRRTHKMGAEQLEQCLSRKKPSRGPPAVQIRHPELPSIFPPASSNSSDLEKCSPVVTIGDGDGNKLRFGCFPSSPPPR
jgi:hypothetical protein